MSQAVVHFNFNKEKPVKKLSCEVLTPNDSKDPSYTNLQVP